MLTISTTNHFIEILDKLPTYRRRQVYDYLEFIYQKTVQEDLISLDDKNTVLPNHQLNETYDSVTELEKKLRVKYGQ